MHWIMHGILQSLENTGAAALDLAPVLRAADLTAAAQLPAASVSVCDDLATAYCSPPRRSVSSLLATAAPHCQYCQWPPHCSCHHLARPELWQSAIGRCLPTFKYYFTLYLSSVCINSLSSGVLISQDEG